MHRLYFFAVLAYVIFAKIYMQEGIVVLQAPPELPVGIKLPFNVEDMAPKMEKPLLEIFVKVMLRCYLPFHCDC